MSKEQVKQELADLLEEKSARVATNKFSNFYFQDHKIDENGQDISRKFYKAHLEFFRAGANYGERAFIAANRSGKTIAGAFEVTCHATGLYPDWWEGKRFNKPTTGWVVGKTHETTRDVLQRELLGRVGEFGTGVLPKDSILKTTSRSGIGEAVNSIQVRHVGGGVSEIGFKAYDQEVKSFMGATKDWVWHDEECLDLKIYSECLTRTMTSNGIIFTTFTPLDGLSPVVMSFLHGSKFPSDGITRNSEGGRLNKYVVNCDWDDAPHLTSEMKENLLLSYSPFEREARTRGIPSIGSGAVYPVFEEDIVVDPFEIPHWYKRAYGMDFGYYTAAIWGAQDPNSGVIYLHSEHFLANTLPAIHAQAIRTKGDWLVGAADPAGGQINNQTGLTTVDCYSELGLNLYTGNRDFKLNAVEPGIAQVLTLLETGTLKIFSNLTKTLEELRVYRRKENTRGEMEVYKRDDHLMDAMRYLIRGWEDVADVYHEEIDAHLQEDYNSSDITGY